MPLGGDVGPGRSTVRPKPEAGQITALLGRWPAVAPQLPRRHAERSEPLLSSEIETPEGPAGVQCPVGRYHQREDTDVGVGIEAGDGAVGIERRDPVARLPTDGAEEPA